MHGKFLSVLLMVVIMLGFHGRRLALAKDDEAALLEKWTKAKELFNDIAVNGVQEGSTCTHDLDYLTKMHTIAGLEPAELANSTFRKQADDYISKFDPENKKKYCAQGNNVWCEPTEKTCICCETRRSVTCENNVIKVVKDRHPDNQKGWCKKGSSGTGGGSGGAPAPDKKTANGGVNNTACGPSCRLFLLLALTTATI